MHVHTSMYVYAKMFLPGCSNMPPQGVMPSFKLLLAATCFCLPSLSSRLPLVEL